ncbi:MAG TPA: TIGR01777 family oxidoreductase [Chryseosolibacter sp.]
MDVSKNILITGGTGLLGTRLTKILQGLSKNVYHLSRAAKGEKSFTWDPANQKMDADALKDADTIIHLAGANVGEKRWTEKRKEEILKSRTESTRLLYDELKNREHSVKHFISASAIGYYGFDNEQKWYHEDSEAGTDFLAQVTRAWEQEVDRIEELGIRVVKIRIGIVLSDEGGALKEIANPVKNFVGGPLGAGTQPVSWIHIDDVCGIFVKAVDDTSMRGAYNAVAPNPVNNRTLTKAIAQTLGRPMVMPPVPAFVLKLIIGQMAEIVVKGSKVSAKKVTAAGYQFKFPLVQDAVNDLLKK